MKVRALVVLVLSFVPSIPAIAQTCSQTAYTNTLICTLPQLFSPIGLTLPNPTHNAHFAGASENLLALPINQGTGQALAILPLGSSGSGTTFTLDSQGHPVPTEDSLGPILTERANVIGKKAVNLGVAYQHFDFTRLDGVHLSNFDTVLLHQDFDPAETGTNTSPVFRQDYIKTTTQVHLQLNQTVIYAVYGFSKRFDASVEVPIQSAHLRVTSTAHIVRTQPCEKRPNATDPSLGGDCVGPLDKNHEAECGEFHYFQGYSNTVVNNQVIEKKDCGVIYADTDIPFPSPQFEIHMEQTSSGKPVIVPLRASPPPTDATGIGDFILRGKYEVFHGEKLVGSVGLGVRFPSGDAKNFLGTGAYGVIPFGALTYSARLSPHVRFGYEWNSHSVLAGDPVGLPDETTGKVAPASASLPAAWLYSGGADFRATKRLTLAADLIGQHVLDVRRLISSAYSLLPESDGQSDPSTVSKVPVKSVRLVANPQTGVPVLKGYNSDSIAVGGKIRLIRELVLIGNATIRVDDGGLRSDVVPLVGLSYAF
jgi:hypothetical protein